MNRLVSKKQLESETKQELEQIRKNQIQLHPRSLIIVDGMDNVSTRIAKCCYPVKNQPIIGYLTKERLITIHKQDCSFVKKLALRKEGKSYLGKRINFKIKIPVSLILLFHGKNGMHKLYLSLVLSSTNPYA